MWSTKFANSEMEGGEEMIRKTRVFLYVLVWALLFLFVIVVPTMASDGEGGSVTAEAFALILAGFVAPYLAQMLKRMFGDVEAMPALWLSFAVSVVLAITAMLVTGVLGWSTPPLEPVDLVSWVFELGLAVFGLATMVYKNLISKPEPEK